MTTRMLINAKRDDHLRVAIIEGTTLKDYHIEIADRGLTRGNIYRGVVANIQPSLGAAFIDIGEERHGFLPVVDVLKSAYHTKPPAKTKRPTVDQVLERRKPILVQVTKDGVGQKGAALQTNLAIAGRYLVLTPFDKSRGISRKADNDKVRKKIRERLGKLNLPDGHGVIVRTNGIEQNMTTLNRDLSALLRLWKRIREEANKGKGSRLLYSDQDLVVQALRDYLDTSIAEVLVDSEEVYEKAQSYMQSFMPRSKTKLIHYEDRLPLFSRYRLEGQIDQIYLRSTPLPSGGSLVIDHTEALTAIDVNSGRSTRADSHDETIFNVNVEAAKETARQLRLRDIGGLVVIDFIDMRYAKHQRKLEKVMRDAMKEDKARYTVGKISANGLLEINRQRIRQALRLRTHESCPRCQGAGTVATPEFAALNVLRRIEGKAITGLYESVTVALNPEIGDALQNRHRRRLTTLEDDLDFSIEILSAPSYSRGEDHFEWKEREKIPEAVQRKIGPALTATDLTLPGRHKPAATEDSDDAKEAAPKKRRRRRRRSRKPKADEQHLDAAQTEDESQGAEAAEDGGEAKPKRPRRRRRTRRKTKADEQHLDADQNDDEAQSADAAEDAPKRPRRRRRTRKPKADEQPLEADQAEGEEQSAEAAEDKGDAKPKRPRRRRTRRKKTEADEPMDSDTTTDDLDSMALEPLFSGPDDGDEAPPPRRRRRTRRKTKADEPTSEASGDDRSKEDVLRYGLDPGAEETAPLARPRRRRRTRKSGDAAAEEAADNGDQATSGTPPDDDKSRRASPPADEEPSVWNRPSQALRWQWWGGPGKEDKAEAAEGPAESHEPPASDSDN